MKGEIHSPKMDLGKTWSQSRESLQLSENTGSSGEYIHSWMNRFVLVVGFTHPQMASAACVYFRSAVARIDS